MLLSRFKKIGYIYLYLKTNKMKNDKIFINTFCLDGYSYALKLREEAEAFGEFTEISEIEQGTMMGDCFEVTGTLDAIKKFHEVYDLDDRGIWFEESEPFLEEVK